MRAYKNILANIDPSQAWIKASDKMEDVYLLEDDTHKGSQVWRYQIPRKKVKWRYRVTSELCTPR